MDQVRFWIWLTSLLVFVPVHLAHAKGPPDKITVRGPGIPGTLELVDREVLNGLELSVFLQRGTRPASPPEPTPGAGVGYELVYYYKNGGTTFMRAFSLVYYPTRTDGPGSIYNPSSVVGKWFDATPTGDGIIQRVLQTHGVGRNHSSLPATGGTSPPFTWLSGLACSLIGAGLLFRVKRSYIT